MGIAHPYDREEASLQEQVLAGRTIGETCADYSLLNFESGSHCADQAAVKPTV